MGTEELIEDLTNEELELLSQEIKCKRQPDGAIKCSISEAYSRALAKAKEQPKRIVFEVTSEPAPAAPDTRLNPTES